MIILNSVAFKERRKILAFAKLKKTQSKLILFV